MAQKKEWLGPQKDALQKNRNIIVYAVLVLALLGTLAGWALLPQQVLLFPQAGGMVARNTALGAHFGICALFAALFWRWPRELTYLAGAVLGLLLMVNVLAQNLGM